MNTNPTQEIQAERRVLVTGANSLLGINVIAALLDKGYWVRSMTRRPGTVPLEDARIEEFTGQITREQDVRRAVKGCGIVIHIAANTAQNSTRYQSYKEVNVTPVRYILDASRAFGVKKTILVSSANTFGYGDAENPGKEGLPMAFPFTKTAYAQSKLQAQQLALSYPEEGMGEVIVVNPTFMIGGFDTRPSSGKILLMNYKKRINFVPPGGKNFVHVRDVAQGVCNAIELGKNRQCYLLSGENMSYREFYQKLHTVSNHKAYLIPLPKTLLKLSGLLGSVLQRLGVKNNLHYYNMRILCVNNFYSNEKARSELQLQQSAVEDAIREGLLWFKNSGMLKN